MAFDERLLYEGDYHEAGGSEALNALFGKGIPFTAVVCANDEMAAGAMAAAHERGSEASRRSVDRRLRRCAHLALRLSEATDRPLPDHRHGPHGRALGPAERLPARDLDVRQRVFKPNFVDRDSVSAPG